MEFYTTITELINSVKDMEISYRNLHTNMYISNKNEIIKIPYKSIIRTYMPFLQKTVIEVNIPDTEINKYKYKPKKISYDLYGTTELWSAILELNNLYSTIDFNISKIKLFDPNEFKRLLNEILIMENKII